VTVYVAFVITPEESWQVVGVWSTLEGAKGTATGYNPTWVKWPPQGGKPSWGTKNGTHQIVAYEVLDG
jgi:hypothetical protein